MLLLWQGLVRIKIPLKNVFILGKKGYMNSQPDIMIMNNHMRYNGLCIEFKSPTNHYQISDAELDMKKRFKENSFRFLSSSDYEKITHVLNNYMGGIRVPCLYCSKQFLTIDSHN